MQGAHENPKVIEWLLRGNGGEKTTQPKGGVGDEPRV